MSTKFHYDRTNDYEKKNLERAVPLTAANTRNDGSIAQIRLLLIYHGSVLYDALRLTTKTYQKFVNYIQANERFELITAQVSARAFYYRQTPLNGSPY